MSSIFTVKPKRVVPETLLFSAKPKIGKTTQVAKLSKCLILVLEPNGSDFLTPKVNKYISKEIDTIDCSQILSASKEDLTNLLTQDVKTKALDLAVLKNPVDRMKALNLILRALQALGKPYDYVAIDTITQADLDAEWAGTELYMDSLQGKSFNRQQIQGQPSTKWPRLEYGHPDYQSVIEIGQNGWRWSRTIMVDLLNLSRDCAKICTIYVSHIKDKMLSKGDKGEVFIRDIALTGAVADIYARNVSAVGTVWPDYEQDCLMISFKGNEDKTGGNRGQIGSYEGEFDWDKIFDLS